MDIIDLLSEEERRKTKTLVFPRDHRICEEGEICVGVYVVRKGNVKISSYSYEGKEIVYNLIERGGVFGNNLVFASDQRYRGNAIASSDCEITFIEKESLKELLAGNPRFLEEYLRIQSDFGKELNRKIKILSFDSARERLEFFLQSQGGEATLKSVSELAEELFLSREATSRLIHGLAKEGSIEIDGKRIRQVK